jgi:AcrR family transcriptional regulator
MPRVSEDHLEQRRRQILHAARRCFIRKGFHQTSMQDIFREAELSAGAVYRYFKSKSDIIRAIATESRNTVTRELEAIVDADPLPPLHEIVGLFTERLAAGLEADGLLRIAPQGWAEAVLDPDVGDVVRVLMVEMRSWWVKLAIRMRDLGRLPADADPHAVGATLLCLMPGFVLQRLLVGDVDATIFSEGVRALTRGA